MHQLVGDLGWTTPYARMREQVRGRWLVGADVGAKTVAFWEEKNWGGSRLDH